MLVKEQRDTLPEANDEEDELKWKPDGYLASFTANDEGENLQS